MVKLTFVVSVLFSLIVINNAFKIEPKIVRGWNAQSGQFPFFGFLEIVNSKRFLFWEMGEEVSGCGASLISDEWAITAAHCVRTAKKLVIHFGKTNLNKVQNTHVPIAVEKKDFLIFPQYNHREALHDIGLYSSKKKKEIPNFHFSINTKLYFFSNFLHSLDSFTAKG